MRVRRGIAAASAALALGLVAPGLAAAATFDVNTTGDTAVENPCQGVAGDCSLRQAINLANNDGGADVVNVPAGHYVLTQGVLDAYTPMTIQGAGARSTIIDGDNSSGVFRLGGTDDNRTPLVSIFDVTVTGGKSQQAGGGILANADLVLTRSTVSNNVAGPGFDGGGIATSAGEAFPSDVRIVDSTISGNSAAAGGGVANDFASTVTIVNSTISNNTANAGDERSGVGGGIYTLAFFGGSVSVFSSTIADNTATGADASGGNIFIAEVSELAARLEPGLKLIETVGLDNTIVSGGGPANCGGQDTPTSNGFNLITDDTCGTSAPGDISADPQLKPLSDTGGQTDTRQLSEGSPAIDNGAPTCTDDSRAAITHDQRTVTRPQGSACDIGAVEFAPPVPVTGQPTNITSTTATLNGSASNPDAKAGTTQFQWGTATDYGQTAGDDTGLAGTRGKLLVSAVRFKTLGAGAQGSDFSAGLTGLQPGTTYHYRVVASNPDADRVGADVSFRTPSTPNAPPEPNPSPSPNPRRPHHPNVRASRLTGRCYRTAFTARVRVHVASTTKLRMVRVKLDGHTVATKTRASFFLRVNVRRLRHGSHVLVIRATDRAGNTTTLRRNFARCAARQVQPRFTG